MKKQLLFLVIFALIFTRVVSSESDVSESPKFAHLLGAPKSAKLEHPKYAALLGAPKSAKLEQPKYAHLLGAPKSTKLKQQPKYAKLNGAPQKVAKLKPRKRVNRLINH